MRNRSVFGATFLLLISLFLSACGTTTAAGTPSATSVATGTAASAPATTAGETLSPESTAAPAPVSTPAPAPVVAAEQTFTTPDGSLSFTYPATWSVATVPDQPNSYALADASGGERATLRDRVETLPSIGVPYGTDTGFRAAVPGIKGTSVVVQGTFGQAVGSQAAAYALATDGSTEPIGRAAIEVPAGGYSVMFHGMTPLKTPTVPPSEAELLASATAFANSPEFGETAKVLASLTLHPDKVQTVGCLGARYKYLKLNGISCDDAKATLDRVEKTGKGSGARNMETTDFICYYAGAGEKKSGQADVICRNKANPEGTSFEAWLK